MTLKKTIEKISDIAASNVLIHSVFAGNSLYEINGATVNDYPFSFVCPVGGHQYERNVTRYTITLFVVDRLLDDNANEIDVSSECVSSLVNIINGIRQSEWCLDIEEPIQIMPFTETEKLSDRCNGAYANLIITVPNESICFEE